MDLRLMAPRQPDLPPDTSLLPSDFEEEIEDLDAVASTLLATQVLTVNLGADACGDRLDKALARYLPDYSRSRIQQWIEAGHVSVDGAPATVSMTVYGDETIEVRPQDSAAEQPFLPEPIALEIVAEDATLLVLNKPAGLVVHPAAGNWSGTLLNGLLHYLPAIASVPRAGIVHRLDKDTSGLMVVAKTITAQTSLVRQLQARTVRREYLALVWGVPRVAGKVDAALGRHPRDRIKMAVLDNAQAKPALTHYRRLATGTLNKVAVSLLACRLETGRTHQIRVHMQSIGHALVGDQLYGKAHLAHVFPRQALHALRLALLHSDSGKACRWEAAPPADFLELLTRAGIDWPLEIPEFVIDV